MTPHALSEEARTQLADAQKKALAFERALAKLRDVRYELQCELHTTHPEPQLDALINAYHTQLLGHESLIRRIQAVGR